MGVLTDNLHEALGESLQIICQRINGGSLSIIYMRLQVSPYR